MDGYVLDGPGLYASEKGEDPDVLIVSPAVLVSRHGHKQTVLSLDYADILHHKRILDIHSRRWICFRWTGALCLGERRRSNG